MTNGSVWGWEGVCPLRCPRSGPQESPSIRNNVCAASPARELPRWAFRRDGSVRTSMELPVGEMRIHHTGRSRTVGTTRGAQPRWGLSRAPCPVPKPLSDSAAQSERAGSSTAGPSLASLMVGTAGGPCWRDGQTDGPLAGMRRQCLAWPRWQ